MSSKQIEYECSVNTRKNRSLKRKVKVSKVGFLLDNDKYPLVSVQPHSQPLVASGLSPELGGWIVQVSPVARARSSDSPKFHLLPDMRDDKVLNQNRFLAPHVNRKWTFFIIAQLLCPDFQANCLYKSKET